MTLSVAVNGEVVEQFSGVASLASGRPTSLVIGDFHRSGEETRFHWSVANVNIFSAPVSLYQFTHFSKDLCRVSGDVHKPDKYPHPP